MLMAICVVTVILLHHYKLNVLSATILDIIVGMILIIVVGIGSIKKYGLGVLGAEKPEND